MSARKKESKKEEKKENKKNKRKSALDKALRKLQRTAIWNLSVEWKEAEGERRRALSWVLRTPKVGLKPGDEERGIRDEKMRR